MKVILCPEYIWNNDCCAELNVKFNVSTVSSNTSFRLTVSYLDHIKIASHRISDVENMIREQEWKRLHTSSHNIHSALVYICLILIGLYILYKLYNWFSGKVSCVKAITDTNRSGNSKYCYIPATRVWPWHKRMCHLLTYLLHGAESFLRS